MQWHRGQHRRALVTAMTAQEALKWAAAVKTDVQVFRAKDAYRHQLYLNDEADPMSDAYKAADVESTHAASNIHRHFNHDQLLALCDWIVGAANGQIACKVSKPEATS